jgi:hypothetical protein
MYSICQFFLFPELLEFYSGRWCLCLYIEVFSLCFPLVISKFQVLHEGLWSTLNWFLHRVGDQNLVSVFCVWIYSFLTTTCWRGCLSPTYVFGSFVKTQMTVFVWAYFWVLFSVPLVCISVFAAVQNRLFLFLRLCSIIWSQVLCSFFRIALAIWDLLSFPMNVKTAFSSSMKNVTGILMGITLNP